MMLPDENGLAVLEYTRHVNNFLLKVNGVTVSLFKVCESYSEARLYLKEYFVKEKEDPVFLGTDLIGFPPLPPEGEISSPPVPPKKKISELFMASMLDLGGRSVMGDKSKGKEGNIFWYSVLDTVKLRNGLVPDPERLPDIMKKTFHGTKNGRFCGLSLVIWPGR
jgi:hypothetical protein